MRLPRVQKDLPRVHVRATIPGELKVLLDAYLLYYQEHYGEPILLETLLTEILSSFFERDREFKHWRASTNGSAGEGAPKPALRAE